MIQFKDTLYKDFEDTVVDQANQMTSLEDQIKVLEIWYAFFLRSLESPKNSRSEDLKAFFRRNIRYLKNEIEKRKLEQKKPKVEPLPTNLSETQLTLIFDKMQSKKVVFGHDKEHFLYLFIGRFKKRVYWNHRIRGAKAGLFDLIERICDIEITAAQLNKRFECEIPIHDKWKPNKNTRFIDEVLSVLNSDNQ